MTTALAPSADRARHRLRRRHLRLAAALLVVVGTWSLHVGATPRAEAATTSGVATITDPLNGKALSGGSSSKVFTVVLPPQAACSGDTAKGGYHVYSFLVHKGTSLSGVTFVNFPSNGYGFVDTTGTYYGPANTAITTGQVVSIPNTFEWAPLTVPGGGSVALSDLLRGGTSGVWQAGLVCANASGAAVDSWSTEVTFTADSSDAAGFTWSAVPGTGTGTTTTTAGSGSTSTTTTGSTSTSTTTTSSTPTSTSTSVGPTTTTTGAGTTTTDPGSTTTTTADPGTTTSSDPSETTLLGSSVDSGGTDPGGGGTGVSSGDLPRTGLPVNVWGGLGLLCIGSGMILLGLDRRWALVRGDDR